MKSFMVVAVFKDGVSQDEIRALIPAEQIQAKILEERGVLGFIKLAMSRRTVFLEAFGEDEEHVLRNIESLPLSALWNIDIYPTTPPAGPNM